MRYSRIPGVAEPISRCVLGTSGIRSEDRHRLLDAFFEAGGNCIDTARAYGGGSAEESVGGWIRKAKPDVLIVIAKGAHPPNCWPEMVSVELAESLEKLGIDRADLYLLHRDDPSIPVAEFVDALEAEVAAGRIGAYGASNWGQQRLAEANAYAAEQLGSTGMVALSNHFSLALPKEPLYPGCESVSPELCKYLEERDIGLFPWSSQARGFFAEVAPESLDPNVWRCWGVDENYHRRERAQQLADKFGVRAINIALSFVMNQPFTTFPIIGPQTEEELSIALCGVDIELEPHQLRWLERGPAG